MYRLLLHSPPHARANYGKYKSGKLRYEQQHLSRVLSTVNGGETTRRRVRDVFCTRESEPRILGWKSRKMARGVEEVDLRPWRKKEKDSGFMNRVSYPPDPPLALWAVFTKEAEGGELCS
jgi:hypothetical protein